MTRKKVVIIGAGIAGLSAGCYLQMNGYESEIYELHNISGGLCTAWKRKDYTFDGCIHWLVGSAPNNPLYSIWREIGAIDDNTEFVNHKVFTRIENDKGDHFSVFTNIEEFEKEMLRISSSDEKSIKEFTDAIRFFVEFSYTPKKLSPDEQRAYGAKVQEFYKRWSMTTTHNFTEKFSNETLKGFFKAIFGDFVGNESSIIFLIMTLASMHAKSAGYPIGGSLPFAKRIENRYTILGGKIHFNARIKKIITDNGSVKGIQLMDDKIINADIVISAADGYDTIFNMLDGKYVNDEIKGYYNTLKPFPSICQLSLGVADSLENEPNSIVFPIDEPIQVDSKTEMKNISLQIYNFDPTLAPSGKTVVISFFPAMDYEYWVKLREENRESYNKEKERLANKIIEKIEKRFPGIKSKIEVIDVSTPATFIRYTNNWKGSYEGWLPTMRLRGNAITETLPGLENFYMVGHWTRPGGGLPPAAMSGKKISKMICEKDGKEFITEI